MEQGLAEGKPVMVTVTCAASPEERRQKACTLLWHGTPDLVSTSRPALLGTGQGLRKRKGGEFSGWYLGRGEECFALTTSEHSKACSMLRNHMDFRDH